MLFDLPPGYLLGLLAWCALLTVGFVRLLQLRRRWSKTAPRRFKWILPGLSLWMFLAALTLVELYFAIIYDQTDSFNMSNVSQHWFRRHVRRNDVDFRDARPFPMRVPAGMHGCASSATVLRSGTASKTSPTGSATGRRPVWRPPGPESTSSRTSAEAGINVVQVTRLREALRPARLPDRRRRVCDLPE